MPIDPHVLRIGSLIVAATLANPAMAAPKDRIAVPDFTKDAKIPKGAKHNWNLGPTGLRGWIYCDRLVTTDARQILITRVDKGSPAGETFQVGDVILGASGKPFSYDPRTELGTAITTAETKGSDGKLTLTRWRAGTTEEVVLRLPVMGSYSLIAPFECEKSKLLLEQGCKALAARMAKPAYADLDPIPRWLNALALLASGNPEYLPLVKKEARWTAGYSTTSMQTWYYGYCMLFLSEYVLATGDESVMPGLKRLALRPPRDKARWAPGDTGSRFPTAAWAGTG